MDYEQMTLRQRARHHLAKAEDWQREVEDLERAAEIQVKINRARRDKRGRLLHNPLNDTPIPYAVKIELRDDWRYSQAVSNRNAHQTQATMYAAMATMEGQ